MSNAGNPAGWRVRAHAVLLHALARVTARHPRESLYPVDRSGRPDLRYYTAPLARYIAMYDASLEAPRGGVARRADALQRYALRLHAVWGLIARGTEARAFAQALLAHATADAREDGAAILAAIAATQPQA